MTHLTCRLTAKNRDQLRNPTLSNRVWVTFIFFLPEPIFETYVVYVKLEVDGKPVGGAHIHA